MLDALAAQGTYDCGTDIETANTMELPRTTWELRFVARLAQLVPHIRRELIRQIAVRNWEEAGDLEPEAVAEAIAINIDAAIMPPSEMKKS